MDNIFSTVPENQEQELIEELLHSPTVRIERIVSMGHTSSEKSWYDQQENEWVVVLSGAGSILFEDGTSVDLDRGDYLFIPAHTKHRVSWTDPDNPTIWLAVFYRSQR